MTIITVIHQPRFSIFSMFDTVLLLGLPGPDGRGSRTVYHGRAPFFFHIPEHADGELPRTRVALKGSLTTRLTESFPMLPSDPI